MPSRRLTLTAGPELVTLERAALRVEISLRPFAFTVLRAGRRLVRSAGAWVADGQIHDHFVQLTEGVLAHEDLAPVERAVRAWIVESEDDGLVLALALNGGRSARLRIELPSEDALTRQLAADGEPLRLALDWDRRSEERLVGLGARHCTQADQAGRTIQLGADRRYTGPDCPPEMLAQGGIPQGDCAPMPWLLSNRGYGVWIETFANGTRIELGERVSVSTRAQAGPLRVRLLCAATPAARLRAFCRLTGFPAVLPEWGYGVWKSRDVHEPRPTRAAGRSPTPTATAPRCGSRRCSTTARASARWRCREASGSRRGRAGESPGEARWSSRRRCTRSPSGSGTAR